MGGRGRKDIDRGDRWFCDLLLLSFPNYGKWGCYQWRDSIGKRMQRWGSWWPWSPFHIFLSLLQSSRISLSWFFSFFLLFFFHLHRDPAFLFFSSQKWLGAKEIMIVHENITWFPSSFCFSIWLVITFFSLKIKFILEICILDPSKSYGCTTRISSLSSQVDSLSEWFLHWIFG